GKRDRRWHRRIGQPRKGFVERGGRRGAERRQIDVEPLDAPAPIILAAVELEDVETLFQQGDEGQEILALESILLEIVGLIVRGGDDDESVFEQGLEESPQQHGVGDVLDLEFVEAEQPGRLGNRTRERGNRITARLAAPTMQRLM